MGAPVQPEFLYLPQHMPPELALSVSEAFRPEFRIRECAKHFNAHLTSQGHAPTCHSIAQGSEFDCKIHEACARVQ